MPTLGSSIDWRRAALVLRARVRPACCRHSWGVSAVRDWIKNMSRSEQIVAAVIGGLFVVAAAVISVVFAQRATTAHAPVPQGTVAAPASTTSSAALPSNAAIQAPAPTPTSAAPVSIMFRGPVEFSGNNGIDFDVNPPTSQGYNNTIGFDTAAPAIIAGSPNYVATWPSASVPTRGACNEWVLTHPLGNAPVQVGTQLCIHSVGLRTVYLKVTGMNAETGTISATVIVWSS